MSRSIQSEVVLIQGLPDQLLKFGGVRLQGASSKGNHVEGKCFGGRS